MKPTLFSIPRDLALRALALTLALGLVAAGCAIAPPDGSNGASAYSFDPYWTAERLPGVDVRVEAQEDLVVDGTQLRRIRFSFLAYVDWIEDGARHRSSGTLWFPINRGGEPALDNHRIVTMTEYPPGASASDFSFHDEYGARVAAEMGMAAVVVSIRGPIARECRSFHNPEGGEGETFRSESQFALTMLKEWQVSRDFELLHETHVARAWRRAMDSVDRLLESEAAAVGNQFLLVAEEEGVLGATRTAAADERVAALAIVGWPLDRLDFETVRAWRWEAASGVFPLREFVPSSWYSSAELSSFLASDFAGDDPNCDDCLGAGRAWRAQFDYATLRRDRWLNAVETLVLLGDADPRFPIDSAARALALPVVRSDGWDGIKLGGPFARPDPRGPIKRGRVFGPNPGGEDFCYVPGLATLTGEDAARAVRAWAQHVAGFRDVPHIVMYESKLGGLRRLDVEIKEGNALVTDVEIFSLEIREMARGNFLRPLHFEQSTTLPWRRLPTEYTGHDSRFVGWWRGEVFLHTGVDHAWFVRVHTEVNGLKTSHSIPIAPTREFRDAAPPMRAVENKW